MDFLSLPFIVQIALGCIAAITVIGGFAAIRSWTRISGEIGRVKRAENVLAGDEAWEEAYPHDKTALSEWMRKNGIKSDSHLGDYIRTSWSAWLGNRPASLTELHVLVARRERSQIMVRLSSGIAALLLVFGIVGTLAAIKPILGNFEFKLASAPPARIDGNTPEFNRTDADVAATTEKVNRLLHNLGNAFWPSLFALIGTILVVSLRGLYSMGLYKFTLDIDRFAVDILIPRYRVVSLSDQFVEMKQSLLGVSDNILERETGFQAVVGKLDSIVSGISPALDALQTATKTSDQAAKKLSARSQSITDGITRTLGANSPLYRAISGFEGIFQQTEKCLQQLTSEVEATGQANAEDREGLKSAVQELGETIGKIAGENRDLQSSSRQALAGMKSELANLPETIKSAGDESIKAGMDAVSANLQQLNVQQKQCLEEAAQSLQQKSDQVTQAAENLSGIKSEIDSTLAAQTEAAQTQLQKIGNIAQSLLAEDLEKVTARKNHTTEILHELKNLQNEATIAIKNQSDEGLSQLRDIGEAVKNSANKGAAHSGKKSWWKIF